MILQKWNYQTYKYEPYKVPDRWNCKEYSADMHEVVNCPHCGKRLLYGNTYTSMEIHNYFGVGYGVCGECYHEEWQRRKEAGM